MRGVKAVFLWSKNNTWFHTSAESAGQPVPEDKESESELSRCNSTFSGDKAWTCAAPLDDELLLQLLLDDDDELCNKMRTKNKIWPLKFQLHF